MHRSHQLEVHNDDAFIADNDAVIALLRPENTLHCGRSTLLTVLKVFVDDASRLLIHHQCK